MRMLVTRSSRFPHYRPWRWSSVVLVPALLLLTAWSARAQKLEGLPAWRWERPLPTGYSLTDVAVLSDSSAVVVGRHGTVMKTTDQGLHWEHLPSGTTSDIVNVAFADAQTGWISYNTPVTNLNTQTYGVGPGEVRRTTDGGRTWTRQPIGENRSVQMMDLEAISPTEAYVLYRYSFQQGGRWVTPVAQLRRTINGGQTWTLVSLPVPNVQVNFSNRALQFPTPTTGYIGGENLLGSAAGQFYKTTNSGQTWQSVAPDPNLLYGEFSFPDAQHGWLISDTVLFRTIDGGQSWTRQRVYSTPFQSYVSLRSVDFTDALHGVALDANAYAYRTTDGGLHWQEALLPVRYSANNPQRVRARAGSAWAIANNGRLWQSADAGQSWQSRTAVVTEEALLRLDAPDPTHAWTAAFGDSAVLRQTRRYGAWQRMSVTTAPLINRNAAAQVVRTAFADPDSGFVAVDNPFITGQRTLMLRTTDAGQSWQTTVLPLPNQVLLAGDLAAYDGRHAVLVAAEGRIFVTADGGQTWPAVPSGTNQFLRVVRWADARTVYVGGDSATLLKSTDAGQSWQPLATGLAPGQSVSQLEFVSAQVGITTAGLTTDGGQSWTANGFGPIPNFYPQGFGGTDIRRFQLLTRDRVWLFGNNNFRSTDGGLTWDLAAQTEIETALSGTAVDVYNAWVVGQYGQLVRYSEKFIRTDTAFQTLNYCVGDTMVVPFTTDGAFGSGEAFRVELSNPMGRFRPGQTTVLTAAGGAGTTSPLRVALPTTLVSSDHYRVRVIRADTSVLGSDNQQDIHLFTRPAAVAIAPTDSVRFCAGDSVQLVAPAGYAQYQWSDGRTAPAIWVTAADTLTVQVATGGGCYSPASAPVVIRVTPRPTTPTFQAQAQGSGIVVLTSSAPTGNQWYLNGNPVPGATGPTYAVTTAAQSGRYTVQVTVAGCQSALSAEQNIVVLGTHEPLAAANGLTLYPNPARTAVRLQSAAGLGRVVILDLMGRVVGRVHGDGATTLDLPLDQLPAGTYQVRASLLDDRTQVRRLLIER